ncbi:hypothetical protein CYLTODRAFT_252765 [Cylindrobasidium torrendii FP15055 ss-10]|uniref:Uncharacterized protein n=1 Tax=Cylindrobasidium torrendii FP15055 ss-10 TaxID=1314674 RepID=A0A0D7BG89_9AGAR|nr:hypothetical protein CYLTODRAFT_252765 [Cylindrobasidium torrendii FP15055 ss-10]
MPRIQLPSLTTHRSCMSRTPQPAPKRSRIVRAPYRQGSRSALTTPRETARCYVGSHRMIRTVSLVHLPG